MTRRLLPLGLVTVATVLALAACNGGGSASSTTPATTSSGGASTGAAAGSQVLQIAADPNGALKYDKTMLSATAGSVTIEFTNMSSTLHNVTLDGPGVEDEATDTISGSTTSKTFDLQPGTYTFYCSVDGHRDAGMEGKLVAK